MYLYLSTSECLGYVAFLDICLSLLLDYSQSCFQMILLYHFFAFFSEIQITCILVNDMLTHNFWILCSFFSLFIFLTYSLYNLD